MQSQEILKASLRLYNGCNKSFRLTAQEQWTEKTVEDVKQVVAQCTTKVVVIRVELDGLRTKISAPTE